MEFAIIVFVVSTVAAAVCVGVLLGYYASQTKTPALAAEPDKFRLDGEALSMEIELKNATASLSAAREENDNLTKRVADLTRHYLDQTDRMREVKQQRDEALLHSRKLESEVARLRESASQFTPKVAAQVTKLASSRAR